MIFSQVAEIEGYSLVAVHGLLISVASLVVEQQALGRADFRNCSSQTLERGLSSCDSVLIARGMWNLPRSGMEPRSPAMAGRLFITEPSGKPRLDSFFFL